MSDLLDRLVESERRRQILGQYNARMAELMADPAERAAWTLETSSSEASAYELINFSEHAAITR